ncbi:hypothetical protein [Mucilaginibacter pedocola]|uniref:Lipoprotein n=1 Tax=Mucilaginibacter pedocola TaxID=1792845 RepID=A0A1S9PF60_9SPHI|nr:hypothetical protein [Mucilaginibacter pedocola]OOQ59238.1 hypothetical protein BC343_28365 [Mucilaginibacter pedocola]
MKKEIVKMLALLLFGAAAISSCAIDNTRHGRYRNDRYHDRGHDRDHHDGHYDNHGGYYHN